MKVDCKEPVQLQQQQVDVHAAGAFTGRARLWWDSPGSCPAQLRLPAHDEESDPIEPAVLQRVAPLGEDLVTKRGQAVENCEKQPNKPNQKT